MFVQKMLYIRDFCAIFFVSQYNIAIFLDAILFSEESLDIRF